MPFIETPLPVRRAILILGMHRSGTSALTRLISEFGPTLPANLMPADANNEAGYWESLPINQALEEILYAAGSSWDDWRPFDPNWHLRPASADAVRGLKRAIESEYRSSPLFVLKDPRLCRLVPLIKDILTEMHVSPLAILIVRHPLEVITSLQKRDQMTVQNAQLLWRRHVLDAEYQTRGWRRAFVSYSSLLANWRNVTTRLDKQLGLSWPDSPNSAAAHIREFISEIFTISVVARCTSLTFA